MADQRVEALRFESRNGIAPCGREAFEQRAERMLLIGVADPAEAAARKSHVAQQRAALRRHPNVRNHEWTPDFLTLRKGQTCAVVSRSGLADDERVSVRSVSGYKHACIEPVKDAEVLQRETASVLHHKVIK